jgi:hypothetical protein
MVVQHIRWGEGASVSREIYPSPIRICRDTFKRAISVSLLQCIERFLASHAEGFHLRVLLEPCVNQTCIRSTP